MTSAWLLRGGENSRLVDSFEAASVVAIGWPDIPGLGDLRELDRSTIEGLLASAGKLAPGQDAWMLTTFRDEIAVGDIVVTPDARTRELLIGEVTGPYRFVDPSPVADYRHVRDAHWFGRQDRDLVPSEVLKEASVRPTLRRLASTASWLGLAEAVRTGGPSRPRTPMARPRRTQDAGGRPPAGNRDPGLDRRCPGCGLSRRPSLFAPGGEMCQDCLEAIG